MGHIPPEYLFQIAGGDDMVNLPVIDMIRTGQNIGRLRKQAGLSVRDLQDIFGFATPQAIYKWQQGVALPTIDNLVVLAVVLQVRMDDILVTDTAARVQNSA
jgi:transcriptional regulator with XRE-family HTH domain